MTELSGALGGLGLPAIVRFLASLGRTGWLRVERDEWRGELFFDAGRVVSASFGKRRGVQAIAALIQALPEGQFTFTNMTNGVGPAERNIDLGVDQLLARLDEVAAQAARGARNLPPLFAIPVVVPQDDTAEADQLQLDRGTLQTLLAVDGRRSVRDIVSARASFETLWQLGSLAEQGLIRLETPTAAAEELDVVGLAALGSTTSTAPPPTPAPAAAVTPPPAALTPPPAAVTAPPASVTPPPSAVTPSAAVTAPPASVTPPPAAVTPPAPVMPPPSPAAAPITRPTPPPAPSTVASPPMGAVDAPTHAVNRPTDAVGTPIKAVGTPTQAVDTPRHAVDTPAKAGPAPTSVAPLTTVRPSAPAEAAVRCPKLGFDDDPAHAFGRPTRLHRCFALGSPLLLTMDQQRELCLSDQYPTCPRLSGALAAEPMPGAATSSAATREPEQPAASRVPEPADQPQGRVVRLPTSVGRDPLQERPTRGATPPAATATWVAPPEFSAAGPSAAAPASNVAADPTVAPDSARAARSAGSTRPDLSVSPAAALSPGRRLLASLRRRLPIIALVVMVVAVVGLLLVPRLLEAPEAPPDLAATSVVLPGGSRSQPTQNAARPSAAGETGPGALAAQPLPTRGAAPAGTSSTAGSSSGTAGPATGATESSASTTGSSPASTGAAARQPTVARASTGILLDERFANNRLGWLDTPQGPATFSSGTYRVTARQPGVFVAIGAPLSDVLRDVVVSATFRKLGGTAGGGFGLIVRDQGPGPRDGVSQDGRYYVLEAGDKGEVGIWRRENNRWIDLMPWQRSDAVRPGTATNDIAVFAIGDQLTLVVNGTEVGGRLDTALSAGRVGVFVGGDLNQVAVERFSVQAP